MASELFWGMMWTTPKVYFWWEAKTYCWCHFGIKCSKHVSSSCVECSSCNIFLMVSMFCLCVSMEMHLKLHVMFGGQIWYQDVFVGRVYKQWIIVCIPPMGLWLEGGWRQPLGWGERRTYYLGHSRELVCEHGARLSSNLKTYYLWFDKDSFLIKFGLYKVCMNHPLHDSNQILMHCAMLSGLRRYVLILCMLSSHPLCGGL